MTTLLLKLILTPTLIGAVSLAGRRWGPAVSGWLVGLPFTSGPITFFVALSQGYAFAAAGAVGTLGGAATQAVFCITYVWLARRWAWPRALAGALLAFLSATAALQALALTLWPMLLLVLVMLGIGLRWWPGQARVAPPAGPLPVWDLPARMLTATVFVLTLTSAAPFLGARLTGLLAPVPIYASVLAGFAHHQQGAPGAAAVLRGLLLGLFAFVGFYVSVASLLEPAGLLTAFAAATAAALSIQGASGWLMRHQRPLTS